MAQENITQSSESLKRMHVLLVDSDTSSLLHNAALLEGASYKVTVVKDQTLALPLIKELANLLNAVIIAEAENQEMDNFTLMRHIHRIKDDLPIMWISAKKDSRMAKAALTHGASFILDKPLSDHDLETLWQHMIRVDEEGALDGEGRANRENRPEGVEIHDNHQAVNQTRLIRDPIGGGKQRLPKRSGADGDGRGGGRGQTLSQISTGKNRIIHSSGSNSRPTWNPELNRRFMDALRATANEVVSARNRQEGINEPNMTLQRAANILQIRNQSTEVKCRGGIAGPLSLTERINQLRDAYRAKESGESVAGYLPSILQPSLGSSAVNIADSNPRIHPFGAERVDQLLNQTSNWNQFVNTSTATEGFVSTESHMASAPNSNTFNMERPSTGSAIEVGLLQGMNQGQASNDGASHEMFPNVEGLSHISNLPAIANTENQSLVVEPSLDANNSYLQNFDEFNPDEIFHQLQQGDAFADKDFDLDPEDLWSFFKD